MDEQKKQKILIGVLAVAILGAGGFWYMGRDASSNNQANVTAAPTKRRVREKKESTTKRTRRKRERKEATANQGSSRRERVEAERTTSSRRKRARGSGKKVKKKKITPAS